MKICELKSFGVFDTAIAFPGKKRSNNRTTEYFEIEYYISATGKAVVNGQTYDIAPGTLLCGKPGQTRRSIFDFRCYYAHLSLPSDSPYLAMLEQAPVFFQIIDCKAYVDLFESLTVHLLSEGYDEESDFINAKLLELFYYLKKDSHNNLNCSGQFDNNRYGFIQHVLEYIRQNYQEPITLRSLADLVGYSPNHLHHVFRTVMGKTPQDYLMEERLRHAKWLLIRTDKTLSEIAYECGFSSQSHLCARFKSSMLCTPGEYRRRNINNYHA